MRDNNYFETNENDDFKRLIDFNRHTGYFTTVNQTEPMCDIDAYATGKDNKDYALELKYRTLTLHNYDGKYMIKGKTTLLDDSIIIEDHKLLALLLQGREGKTPLYVNFYKNGYTTIHNINQITTPRKTEEKKIKSKGYGEFEVCKRYLLPLEQSTVFDKQYKILQKYKK